MEGKLRPREVTQWGLILSKADLALTPLPDQRLIVQKGETEVLSGMEYPAFLVLVTFPKPSGILKGCLDNVFI